jgi:aminoglycoside phosphotransferase
MVEQPASRPYIDAPLLPGLDDVPHYGLEAARARLDQVAADLPVKVPKDIRFAPGASNDVWDLGDAYLRVCWRADRDRLLRDAKLANALPEGVPHAPVHAYGRTEDLSWALSVRVPGTPLSELRATPNVAGPVLRDVFRQVAQVLKTLHDWAPGPEVRNLLDERPDMRPADPLSVFGSDLVLLPTWRILTQVELAKSLAHVDAGLIDAVAERIVSLSDADPFASGPESGVVVHSDPSLGNWLVSEGEVTALVDFEWARTGPRDLELVVPIFTAQRALPDEHSGLSTAPYLSWLAEDYPLLFAAPDLDRRLWLYELCFFLRGIIWWPPSEPEPTLEAGHHLHTLRRLLEAPLPRGGWPARLAHQA